jgi:hypothetical protein
VEEEVMGGDPEYRRFQFAIADLLAVTAMVALLLGTSRLPASSLHVIPLLAVLYLVKFRILTFRVRPWVASLLYFLVVAALLPYLYCSVVDDWGNRFVNLLATWIGWHGLQGKLRADILNSTSPIITFTVPTMSFFLDTLTRKRPSAWFYALRSLVEVIILVPLWALVWGCVEFLAVTPDEPNG